MALLSGLQLVKCSVFNGRAAGLLLLVVVPVVTTWSWGSWLVISQNNTDAVTQVAVGVSPAVLEADALQHPPLPSPHLRSQGRVRVLQVSIHPR